MRRSVRAFALLTGLSFTSATCYYPNGTAVSEWSPTYSAQPCSNDTSNPLSNVCCSINRSNPSGGSVKHGFTADKCLPNGLCQNVLTDSDGAVLYSYWRDYCADRDWTTGKCLKNVCTGSTQQSDDGSAEMTPCGDSSTATRWCCGQNNTDCCDSSNSADSADLFLIPVSLGGTIASTTSTATATATSSFTSANSSSELSTGAKAGIGVGAGIGAVLIISLIAGLVLYRRRRANAKGSKTQENGGATYEAVDRREYAEAEGRSAVPPGYEMVDSRNGTGPSEMGGREINEVDGTTTAKYKRNVADPVELP